MDEQAALHQAALEEKDSELTNMRELLDTQDITTLEASSREIREERERLLFRYNELGLSMVTAQEELDEARTLAGANSVATASMTRQIDRSWIFCADNWTPAPPRHWMPIRDFWVAPIGPIEVP